MPYEIHAYCASETPPTVGELLAWLRDEENGWGLHAEAPETSTKGLASARWKEFYLRYGRKKTATEAQTFGIYRNTGPRSLCARMVRGRVETVTGYKDSPGKRRVLDCLGRTRFLIWCRIDNDSDRDRASPVLDLVASLLDRYDAVYDLEDEGFLADSDTPLCGWCNHDE